MRVYSVKDLVAQEYGPPVLARNDKVASRMYLALLAQNKLDQNDFELYALGEFDSDTGMFRTEEPQRIEVILDKKAGLEEVM